LQAAIRLLHYATFAPDRGLGARRVVPLSRVDVTSGSGADGAAVGADPTTSAAASRRQLHTELQRLRLDAGLTQSEVARAQEWSPSKVHRIEKGHVSIGRPDLLALLQHYGVRDQQVVDSLLELARLSRNQPMPFRGYRDTFSPEIIRFWGYEASACWIGELELLVMPGLLQTPDYTRALIRDGHGVRDDSVDRFVESRRERQQILDRATPPALSFLLDETVMSRAIGGVEIMSAQLRHLLRMAERPNVSVRVLPLALGAHAGLRGPFVLLRFAAENDPDIVYIENRRGDSIFENDAVVTNNHIAIFQELEQLAAPATELEYYVKRALDKIGS
jgi:transcriptional regulator with XRE-family HTH domain